MDYRVLARKGGPLSAIAAPLASSGKILGAICAFSWEARAFSENDKRVFSIIADNLGVAIDNSRRQETERHQNAAYSELFREVNRQVRSSLQTIVSLLEITSAASNLSGEAALRRALQRIQCIHLIHSLISARQPNQMEIREGTRQIAEMAQSDLGRSSEEINIGVAGARTFLSPQKATAFSLAVNELIHNALKHGLRERPCGKINISFSQSGGQLLVEISDNGCGLPESFELAKDAGLGLRLAADFVQQKLAGDFRLFRRPAGSSGTIAQIRFPC
jgi:two-component sensor histidine kinase